MNTKEEFPDFVVQSNMTFKSFKNTIILFVVSKNAFIYQVVLKHYMITIIIIPAHQSWKQGHVRM